MNQTTSTTVGIQPSNLFRCNRLSALRIDFLLLFSSLLPRSSPVLPPFLSLSEYSLSHLIPQPRPAPIGESQRPSDLRIRRPHVVFGGAQWTHIRFTVHLVRSRAWFPNRRRRPCPSFLALRGVAGPFRRLGARITPSKIINPMHLVELALLRTATAAYTAAASAATAGGATTCVVVMVVI